MDVESDRGNPFRLHMRCFNCKQDMARTIYVPRCEEAPQTVEELVESSFIARQSFFCGECDSPIGVIVAITIPSEEAA